MPAEYVPHCKQKVKLKNGLYRYKHDCSYDRGEIVIKLTETDKSFKMELVKNTIQFTPAVVEMLFKNGKAVVQKRGSRHAMNFSGDNWFCIYPYQAGVPLPFRYVEETAQMELF